MPKQTQQIKKSRRVNFKIKNLLLILTAVPLIIIVYFSATNIYKQSQILSNLAPLIDVSELTAKISSHIHEMQKERGVTAGFMGSDGKTFATQLIEQRKITDTSAQELEKFLITFNPKVFGSQFEEVMRIAFAEHGHLANFRKEIDLLSIDDDDAIAFYTEHNAKMLDIVHQLAIISDDAETSRMISAYVSFMEAKEQVGLERAIMTRTFAADSFTERDFLLFTYLHKLQDAYFDTFTWYAHDHYLALFKNLLSNPIVAEVKRMEDIALEKGNIFTIKKFIKELQNDSDAIDIVNEFSESISGNFGVDSEYWFSSITKKIDLMKDIEDKIAEDLMTITQHIKKQAQRALYFNIGLALVMILGMILLSIFIGRSITKPIEALYHGVNVIEKGNLDYRVGYEGGGEVGQLARAFDKMTMAIKQSRADVDKKVKQQTKDIIQQQKKTEESKAALEKMNESMSGRELKMIQLKREIMGLKQKLNKS